MSYGLQRPCDLDPYPAGVADLAPSALSWSSYETMSYGLKQHCDLEAIELPDVTSSYTSEALKLPNTVSKIPPPKIPPPMIGNGSLNFNWSFTQKDKNPVMSRHSGPIALCIAINCPVIAATCLGETEVASNKIEHDRITLSTFAWPTRMSMVVESKRKHNQSND